MTLRDLQPNVEWELVDRGQPMLKRNELGRSVISAYQPDPVAQVLSVIRKPELSLDLSGSNITFRPPWQLQEIFRQVRGDVGS
jgi:hypothetical protein